MVSNSYEDPILKNTISYWEAILFHDQFLFSPSVKVLLENTIKYLKEFKKIKDGKIKGENK